ncbi:hypothetical protein [Nonomuraea aridisoli]|uniref:hypothetical protein n=1 Tax=Nonomuraea aridisoli TaxID=2070368 RepID=UPI0011B940FB|nr:hypothetical protein [Nonomuraea aridisoli]
MTHVVAPLAVVVLATACTAPEKGQVIAKQHHPAYSWVQTTCTAYNKHGMCTTYAPITQQEPERWVLTLRSGDVVGDRPVTREAFQLCRRGEMYPACAGKTP